MPIKISELTNLGEAPASTDELPIVDDSASATKKVTVGDLFTSPTFTGTVVSDGLDASTGDITTTSIGFDGSRTTTPDDLSYPIIWRSAGAHPDFSGGDLVIQARSDSDRDIHFVTGNTPTERMNIDGQTGDISFYEDTGTTAKLTWDASAESLDFADNAKATFGAGSDLQIYHDGSNSYISDAGTGNLKIGGANVEITTAIGTKYFEGAAHVAKLFHTGNEKLATTATGVDVTGTVTADGLTVQTAGVNYLKADQSLGSLMIQTNGANNRAFFSHNGDVSLYEDTGTTAKFFWDASAESLGIGQAPTSALHVINSAASGESIATLEAAPVKNGYVYINGDDNRRKSLVFQSGGVDKFSMGVGDSDELSTSSFFIGSGKHGGSAADLVIDSAGNVGIGTDSPSTPLHVSTASENVATFASTDTAARIVITDGTDTGYVNVSSGKVSLGQTIGLSGNNLNIDSIGNVGIGTSSPSSVLHLSTSNDPKITLTDTGFGASADITGSNGNLRLNSQTATIFDMAESEVMRIDSAGNVGIGTSTNLANGTLNVESNGTSVLQARSDSAGVNDGDTSVVVSRALNSTAGKWANATYRGYSHAWSYGANAATNEAMRIDSSGNLLVGTTSESTWESAAGFRTRNSGSTTITRDGNPPLYVNRLSSDGTIVQFQKGTSVVGSISVTSSATAYNTSSDQRLKDNIVDAPSASDDIEAIQVRSFDWKADGSHQKYGMVAQELQAVAPEAVTEGETEDDMMAVDYSKLVPMLVKEIQSLRARVAQLEGEN